MSIRIRGAIWLEVGEVVHAALLERVGSHALRCLKQALYPGILLPEGWREVVPTDWTDWADEDVVSSPHLSQESGASELWLSESSSATKS